MNIISIVHRRTPIADATCLVHVQLIVCSSQAIHVIFQGAPHPIFSAIITISSSGDSVKQKQHNNNNHLESWDIPFQPREEFSRRGLLHQILGGIFNFVILRIPALPNPRYPALPRQDTSYTWTLADRCYQLRLHSRRIF